MHRSTIVLHERRAVHQTNLLSRRVMHERTRGEDPRTVLLNNDILHPAHALGGDKREVVLCCCRVSPHCTSDLLLAAMSRVLRIRRLVSLLRANWLERASDLHGVAVGIELRLACVGG